MLIPAIRYKDEIEKHSDTLRYSEQMLFYNGCREHGRMYINDRDDDGEFQWAITDRYGNLIGYIAYRVDFFSSSAYSFGLISFADDKMTMAMGIRDAIRHIEAMNIHRIEFRCIADNPARDGYESIIRNMYGYQSCVHVHYLNDVFKDAYGKYHDVILYELIRR